MHQYLEQTGLWKIKISSTCSTINVLCFLHVKFAVQNKCNVSYLDVWYQWKLYDEMYDADILGGNDILEMLFEGENKTSTKGQNEWPV